MTNDMIKSQEATSNIASTDSDQVMEFPTLLDFTAGEPIKSNSCPYKFAGCGNNKKLCLEVMFGVFLCQEMFSIYKRQHPHEVSNVAIKTVHEGTFNLLLCKFCSGRVTNYDEKYHHTIPQYMIDDSLSYLKALVEAMRAIEIIKRKCDEYNMA